MRTSLAVIAVCDEVDPIDVRVVGKGPVGIQIGIDAGDPWRAGGRVRVVDEFSCLVLAAVCRGARLHLGIERRLAVGARQDRLVVDRQCLACRQFHGRERDRDDPLLVSSSGIHDLHAAVAQGDLQVAVGILAQRKIIRVERLPVVGPADGYPGQVLAQVEHRRIDVVGDRRRASIDAVACAHRKRVGDRGGLIRVDVHLAVRILRRLVEDRGNVEAVICLGGRANEQFRVGVLVLRTIVGTVVE